MIRSWYALKQRAGQVEYDRDSVSRALVHRMFADGRLLARLRRLVVS